MPFGREQHGIIGQPAPGTNPTYYETTEERFKEAIRCFDRWLKPGDLVFDLGANHGEYTMFFLSMSCRVVALEPNPDIAGTIDERAHLHLAAAGAEVGRQVMAISDVPYLSTFSQYSKAQSEMAGFNFGKTLEVDVLTLDWLIDKYGVPDFVKIDTEGWEAEVLRGLSHPLPALSFEIQPWDEAKTGACFARLAELGDYDYLYADGWGFRLGPWPPYTRSNFGDVYATLRP